MNQRQKEIVVKGRRKCGADNFRKTGEKKRNMFCQKKSQEIDFQFTEDGRGKCNFST